MIENVKITKAEFNDLTNILRIQKTAFVSEADSSNDFNLEPLTQTIDSIETDYNNYLFLKAEYEDQIVGCVKARETGEFCRIDRLVVSPKFRHRGIGRNLMTEIEKAFPKTKLYLLCPGYKNSRNIGFYESMGYRKKELDGESQDQFLLVKMIKDNVKKDSKTQ
jgi:ribosomal protein S18 acetylase RimI-like enzyme